METGTAAILIWLGFCRLVGCLWALHTFIFLPEFQSSGLSYVLTSGGTCLNLQHHHLKNKVKGVLK